MCIVSFFVLFFFSVCVLRFLVSLIFKKSYQFIPFIVCCSVTFLVELQDAVCVRAFDMFWTTAIPLRRVHYKSNSQSLFLFFSECDVNFEKPRKDEVDLLKVKKRTECQSSTFNQSVAGVLAIIQSGASNFDLFRNNITKKRRGSLSTSQHTVALPSLSGIT